MEGVGACCVDKGGKPFRKDWMEGGRSYKLVLHSNRAGRFLLNTTTLREETGFSLVFPEGKGFLGGWQMLSSKLRSLGVSPVLKRVEEPFAISKQVKVSSDCGARKKGSFLEVVSKVRVKLINTIWIQI